MYRHLLGALTAFLFILNLSLSAHAQIFDCSTLKPDSNTFLRYVIRYMNDMIVWTTDLSRTRYYSETGRPCSRYYLESDARTTIMQSWRDEMGVQHVALLLNDGTYFVAQDAQGALLIRGVELDKEGNRKIILGMAVISLKTEEVLESVFRRFAVDADNYDDWVGEKLF